MSHTSMDENMADLLSLFMLATRNDVRVLNKPVNMYILILGDSSITHKSTAIRTALMGTNGFNTLGTLAGMKNVYTEAAIEGKKSVIFHADEFGLVMKGIKNGALNHKAIMDALNSLYDGDYTFPTMNTGAVEVEGVKTFLVASTTPAAFKASATRELLEGGFLKRFIVCQPHAAVYTAPWNLGRNDIPLATRHEHYGKVYDMAIDEEVKAKHTEMMEQYHSKLDGLYQRAELNLFRLAAVYAAFERGDSVITMDDYKMAYTLIIHSITTQYMAMKDGK